MERQPKIRLYVDDSRESHTVIRALEGRGTEFAIVYASRKISEVPALETMYGRIAGWPNLCRYILTPKECQFELIESSPTD